MHEGHRKRMCEKLKNSGSLFDHEVLEILLFNAYPRVNTNPIAHSLIQAFGSLRGVFEADFDQLMTVEGVGANTAYYLMIVGECFLRTYGGGGSITIKNFNDVTEFAAMSMRGQMQEVLQLFLTDKSGKIIYTQTYTSGKLHRVDIDPEKISSLLAVNKPYGLFVAHNHLGKDCNPSANDDDFTRALALICKMNNVKLYDHVVYASDNNVFSYYTSGRLDKILK